MLSTIGVQDIDELFSLIPVELQLDRLLDIPPALSEIELEQTISNLAAKNLGSKTAVCFMGGGAYDHYVPSVVDEITSRGDTTPRTLPISLRQAKALCRHFSSTKP